MPQFWHFSSLADFWLYGIYRKKIKNTINGDGDDDGGDGKDPLWPRDYNEFYIIFHFYNKFVRLVLLISFATRWNITSDRLNKLPKDI